MMPVILSIACVVASVASVCSSRPQPVYSVDFAGGAKDCSFDDYKERTPWSIETVGGRSHGVFTRPTEATKETKDTSWGLKTGLFTVRSGCEYAISLVLEGHAPSAAHIKPGARIEWFDGSGKPIISVDALGKDVPMVAPVQFPLRKTDLGVTRTITKGFVPQGVAKGRIFFGADYPDLNKGERIIVREVAYFEHAKDQPWYFDDVDAPELEMLTPSPTADVNAPIRFRLVDKSGVDYASVSCKIDGREIVGAELVRSGDVFTYAPLTPWKPESVVRVEVSSTDVKGFSGVESGFVAVSATKVRHAKWKVRDDGVLLKNGEPFFPIGIAGVYAAPWCDGDLDRGIAELKANGINCVHTYMVRGRRHHEMSNHYGELVAATEKHGLVFMAEPATRHGSRDERDAMIGANTLFGRTSAAQFGWGIGDDTSRFESPLDLKRYHRFCKASDSDLLTVSIDAVCAAAQQAPYVPFADVLILEDYPIRKPTPQDEEMAVFAQVLDNGWEATRLSGVPNRSVMSMPQTFRGWGSWERYPTKDEIRCEMFLSLACRARGIITYTSYSTNGNEGPLNRPETAEEFLSLTREISSLLPSLVLRDAAEQPKVTVTEGPAVNVRGDPSVRCLLKEDGLIVVANSSHQTVKASVRLPSGKVLVRTLPRNAGWAERTIW